MEALAALGLASNIVQFIQFTSNVIGAAVELRDAPAGSSTTEILTLDALYTQLHHISVALEASHERAAAYLMTDGPAVASFRTLSALCKEDCKRLLETVSQLRVQPSSSGKWKSFRVALKVAWKKSEIKDLEDRLSKTQTTMTLHVCTIAR